jgi:hypothetical protein
MIRRREPSHEEHRHRTSSARGRVRSLRGMSVNSGPPELHAWSRIALGRVYVEVASARMECAMARRLAHRSGMVIQ